MKTILFTLFSLMMLLHCQSAEQVKYLDSLKTSGLKSGWGKTQKNTNINKKPLSIDGKVYERGLGTHAEFYGKVRLNKTASRFQAIVGLDDGSSGRVEFQIKLDGKSAWKSGVMNKGDAGKSVDLQLKGAEFMELIVTDGGNTNGRATIASKNTLKRLFMFAKHQASGVPITNKIMVVIAAIFNVVVSAKISAAVFVILQRTLTICFFARQIT